MLRHVPRGTVRVHDAAAAARRQRGRRVPVRDAQRLLRALRLGLHRGDARGRRAGARRHRLPGRRVQPVRRLPDRAAVRRARVVGGLDRRSRLGARRPDRGRRAGAHPRRTDRRRRRGRAGAGSTARREPALLHATRTGLGRRQRFLEPARRALRRATRSSTCCERLGVEEPDWRALGLGLAAQSRRVFRRAVGVPVAGATARRRATGRRDCTTWSCGGCARAASSRAPRKARSHSCTGRSTPVPTSRGHSPRSVCCTPRSATDPRPGPAELQRLKHLVNALRRRGHSCFPTDECPR